MTFETKYTFFLTWQSNYNVVYNMTAILFRPQCVECRVIKLDTDILPNDSLSINYAMSFGRQIHVVVILYFHNKKSWNLFLTIYNLAVCYAVLWWLPLNPTCPWNAYNSSPQGLYSLRRHRLISMGIPIINLRRSSPSQVYHGDPYTVRRRLLSE